MKKRKINPTEPKVIFETKITELLDDSYEVDFTSPQKETNGDINYSNNSSQPLLLSAMTLGNIERLKSLIYDERVNVNFLDEDGDSPLFIGLFGKLDIEILKVLIEAGADVNFTTHRGLSLWSQIIYYSIDENETAELAKAIIKTGKLENKYHDSYYHQIKLLMESEVTSPLSPPLIGMESMIEENFSSEN
jgi:hypothetical protein